MKKAFISTAIMALCVMTLAAQAKPRLAILPFTGGATADAEAIAEFFSYEDEINKVFIPVPRTSAVTAIMKEQQFQRSGLTDSDTIAALGKQLNADYVLAGHITSLGNSKLLLITIVHVEQLRQIAGDYREYQQIESVVDMMGDMAKRIGQAVRTDVSRLPRLAVLPFNVPAGVNAQDAEVLAQLLATEVANSGKYAVFPRTRSIEQVMKEHHIERSGLTDADSIRIIGEAVNAQYVLSASVRNVGKDNYFSGSILHIVEASQGQGDRRKYQTINEGIKLMPELARVITGGTAPSNIQAPAAMVLVPAGSFQMGSNNGDSDEKPVHSVTISKPFYMGKYEVTQKEWMEVMGTNPSNRKGDNLPVEQVSWNDAVE
ncbi:MAG: SUMF1/EgtB/PvdO family nonheme iron enzyme, partial [Treponema sp.]|nr:SUMF1/EgtB/PvdO family nonheme iron enzyme [Treponema sp.]